MQEKELDATELAVSAPSRIYTVLVFEIGAMVVSPDPRLLKWPENNSSLGLWLILTRATSTFLTVTEPPTTGAQQRARTKVSQSCGSHNVRRM